MENTDKIKAFLNSLSDANKATAHYRVTGSSAGFSAFSKSNRDKMEEIFFDQRKIILLLRSFRNSALNHFLGRKRRPLSFFLKKEKISWLALVGDIVDKLGCPIILDKFASNWEDDVELGITEKTKATFVNFGNEYWLTSFQILASKAYFIFLIPEDSPGVLNEIEFIKKENLFHKVMIFIPPIMFRKQELFDFKINSDASWEFIQERLLKFGFNLPNYIEGGAIYIPNDDLSISKVYSFKPAQNGNDIFVELENAIRHLMYFVPDINHSASSIFFEIGDLLFAGKGKS